MAIYLPKWVKPPGKLLVSRCAGWTDDETLESGMQLLRDAGYACEAQPLCPGLEAVSGTLCAPAPPLSPLLDGPDFERARSLIHGIMEPGVDAVLAARGGYGTMRVIEVLPQRILARHPTWLVGYSDITALHLWAYGQGVASIHAPVVAGLPRHSGDDPSLAALLSTLQGDPPPLPATPVLAETRVEGPLIGGNLSLLAALRPTNFWPQVEGTLLFIEEVSEPLYRIDRMLSTLRIAGGLESVAAFVVGQFQGCGRDATDDPQEGEELAQALVIQELLRYGRPVLRDLPIGHGAPNLPFIHGATYRYRAGHLSFAPSRKPVHFPKPPPLEADEIIRNAHLAGITPGLQLHVSSPEGTLLSSADGLTGWSEDAVVARVTEETLFDVASVTKAVCTALLSHIAIHEGLVRLDDTCPAELSVAESSLRDLLRHTSGLPAHVPVWEEARRADNPRRAAREAFAAIAPDRSRIGHEIYSDVGYVALGRWLERLFDLALDELFEQRVALPLGISEECGFGLWTNALYNIAATERCSHHGYALQGVVHDENCQVLGGVAGHAGIFATARAIATIARSLLGQGPELLPPPAVEDMWSLKHRVGSYTLGWDTPSGPNSNAGSILPPRTTVGHLGFTGCSLWVERQEGTVIVLHTNRVHPSRDNAGIRWLRPQLHDAIVREMLRPPHSR